MTEVKYTTNTENLIQKLICLNFFGQQQHYNSNKIECVQQQQQQFNQMFQKLLVELNIANCTLYSLGRSLYNAFQKRDIMALHESLETANQVAQDFLELAKSDKDMLFLLSSSHANCIDLPKA